jgi:PIN domain nuclease of toxin-antitoxin system
VVEGPVRVLTDTHTLVWALTDPNLLSEKARRLIAEGDVAASAANLWELVLKAGKNGALVQDPLPWWERYVTGNGIIVLPIRAQHVMALGSLGAIHRDPFDRILLAQASYERRILVSKDPELKRYTASVVW